MAIVALGEQRITVYDAQGKILQAPVSTGQTGYETPAGIYSVIQKEAEHYSNLYDDASMPFMQRITWSGIALHAGVLPGHPASHGCVRMPYDFAQHLFDKTSKGMRVIVMPRDVAPADITHPSLFKPKIVDVGLPALTVAGTTGQVSGVAPKHMQALRAIADAKASEVSSAAKKAEEARQAAVAAGAAAVRFTKALRMAERERTLAEAQLKEAEKTFDEATATSSGTTEKAAEVKAAATSRLTEAQTRLDSLKSEGQPTLDAAITAREAANLAEAARVAAIVAAREANAKMLPVSVFISRETQRLYVRQAFSPCRHLSRLARQAARSARVYTALAYIDTARTYGGGRLNVKAVLARRVEWVGITPVTATQTRALQTLEMPRPRLIASPFRRRLSIEFRKSSHPVRR
jgi:F0F1-type ATP synthase epsilon subunit